MIKTKFILSISLFSLSAFATDLSVIDSRFVQNFYLSDSGTLQFRVGIKTPIREVRQFKLLRHVVEHTRALAAGNSDPVKALTAAQKAYPKMNMELILENGYYNAYQVKKDEEITLIEKSSSTFGGDEKEASKNVKFILGENAFEKEYYKNESGFDFIGNLFLFEINSLSAFNLSSEKTNYDSNYYHQNTAYKTEDLNDQMKECTMIQFDEFKAAKDELAEAYTNFDEVFLKSNLSTTKFAFQISDLSQNQDGMKFYTPISSNGPRQLIFQEIPVSYLKERVSVGFTKTTSASDKDNSNYAFEFKVILADTKDILDSSLPKGVSKFPLGEAQSCLVKSKEFIRDYFKKSFEHLKNIQGYEQNMLRARANNLKD